MFALRLVGAVYQMFTWAGLGYPVVRREAGGEAGARPLDRDQQFSNLSTCINRW